MCTSRLGELRRNERDEIGFFFFFFFKNTRRNCLRIQDNIKSYYYYSGLPNRCKSNGRAQSNNTLQYSTQIIYYLLHTRNFTRFECTNNYRYVENDCNEKKK